MAPPLVELSAFEEWLGHSLDADEQSRAGAILDGVSSLVRSEAGRTWIDDTGQLEDVPADIQMVVKDVARGVYTNPDRRVTERIGDYSYSLSASEISRYFTPDQRAVCRRYRPNQRGLWTMGTTRDDPLADHEYVPVQGSDTMFPWYSPGGFWP